MAVAAMSHSRLADIAEFIFTDATAEGRLKTIRWLQARNLLASQMTCTCRGNMNLIERDLQRGEQDDKWAWKCPECSNVRSIRSGSWFERVRCPLGTILYMVHSWATGRAVGEATADVNITKKMGINIFQWCRDMCSWTLINGSTILLGGPGAIVQIDESVLTHQGKGGRGHQLPPVWVFGMVDTTHVPALGYMQIVSNRDAATLYPIIQAHIRPGTVIWSDKWAAYNRLATTITDVAGHQTVNHSLHFKDPATGVHTNTIESYWNRVKAKLKTMKGVRRESIPCYLDEFMWREWYGRTSSDAFHNILDQITNKHPLP